VARIGFLRRFWIWLRRLFYTALVALLFGYAVLVVFGGEDTAAQLGPWHTEPLTAEFTSDKTDEIRTFADYRRLEDDLFRQLDQEIYADAPTGPEFRLARYSPGSVADPRGRVPDWNRSFEMPVDDAVGGVLLLHGLTDAPYSLRALGETLHARGYWVLGLRLPGHGTAPSGLRGVQWQDMAAAVRLGAKHLSEKVGGGPIHIAGYSTGAPLAVEFALSAPKGDVAPVPASLVLISPAIGVHPTAALARIKNGLSLLPRLGNLAWLQVVPEFDPYKYNSFATNAAAQVYALTQRLTALLTARAAADPENVLPPTLVIKSVADATVSVDAVVDRLLAPLAPERHELVLFDINRSAVKSKLLIADPAPLTDRLMADSQLPFAVTFVTNRDAESSSVVARRKPALSAEIARTEPLNLAWPDQTISLSHVALPFPPDDPLYGRRPPDNEDVLFLGEMALRGERGLLRFPEDWLMRLRYNPFYDYMERRAVAWIDAAGR